MSLDVLLSTTRTASKLLGTVLTPYQWHALDAAVAAAVWILLRWLRRPSRQQLQTTRLRGPPSESFLYGVEKRISEAKDFGAVYEAWAQEYGPAYIVPSILGKKRIVLCDPKAITHFYSKDTWTYVHNPTMQKALENLFNGQTVLSTHGEIHKKQRKYLTPAFSVAAIRRLTSVFYDSAYKAKGAWDVIIESTSKDSAIIEVQNWMNHVSLDTIGLGGFSHDFGALEGKDTNFTEVFDSFNAPFSSTTLEDALAILLDSFPFLLDIPTSRMRRFHKLTVALEQISSVLMARAEKEMEMGVVGGEGERSIIGLLIKGSRADSDIRWTRDEIVAQMKQLLLAGVETVAISLSWALIELSRNPEVQTKLRSELLEHGADPTYDQLTTGLPYLDAVVHEILRVHPPSHDLTRIADEDDVIPLSEPVRTRSGELVNSLTVAKGALVTISMQSINRSAAIWGEDAKVFRPGRWLEDASGRNGIPAKAKGLQGHRHLLTFVDGPRICLGRNFALIEFKVVLTVLLKNFVFELRDGIDSKIEIGRGMLPRPKVAGELGCELPLRVRPYIG